MKTSDFMNTVTVESLQKDLRNKYGVSVDLAKYSKEQLESYSHKIQNKLKEFELKHNFNESLNNDEFQKTLLISKIVESAINQYIDNPLESVDEEDLGEDVIEVDESDADVARDFTVENPNDDIDDDPGAGTDVDPNADKNVSQDSKVLTALRAVMDDKGKANLARMAIEKILQGKPLNKQQIDGFRDAMQSMMEPFLNMQGVQRLKAMKRGMGAEAVGESKVVKEGAEEQAELTMAAKDMVDRFTAFLEDVAEMGAEGMLELADSIRDEMGQEQSDAFVATVKPALEATQEVLTTSREALTAGVGIITGETAPTDTIGAEPEGDIEEPMDTDEPVDPIDPAGDEFSASEPATGGDEPEGREKRESYTPKKKSIEESTRIMNKLAQ
tara:strand:- start:3808 stop:4965 length:1158 start_codon:yes stop_codon:yes gene_type:complete